MHRRYALGHLRPPRRRHFLGDPRLIAKYQFGSEGWIAIAGAEMALGARLMLETTVGSGTGVWAA